MPSAEQRQPCDTCDEKLRKDKSDDWCDRRQRYLAAYGECGAVAPAARLAGVHRATVYRWMDDPTFAAAVRVASEEYFRRVRVEASAAQDARRRWRAARERERHTMRCHYLALARAAKRRK